MGVEEIALLLERSGDDGTFVTVPLPRKERSCSKRAAPGKAD